MKNFRKFTDSALTLGMTKSADVNEYQGGPTISPVGFSEFGQKPISPMKQAPAKPQTAPLKSMNFTDGFAHHATRNPANFDLHNPNNQWMQANPYAAAGKGQRMISPEGKHQTYSAYGKEAWDTLPAGNEGFWGMLANYLPMLEGFVYGPRAPSIGNGTSLIDRAMYSDQMQRAMSGVPMQS